MSYFFQSSSALGDGSGKYTLQQVEGLQPGTKIVLSLRKEDAEFSDETIVRDIVKKYSNFVGTDVHLNGEKINTLQPVWLMDPKEAGTDSEARAPLTVCSPGVAWTRAYSSDTRSRKAATPLQSRCRPLTE